MYRRQIFDWLPTSAYSDTGERNRFVRSALPGEAEGGSDLLDALAIGGNESDNAGAQLMNEAVPLPDPTPSAGILAHMQGGTSAGDAAQDSC